MRLRSAPTSKCFSSTSHSSIVDIFLAIQLSPVGTVGVAKKQVVYYPFFGLLYLLSGIRYNHLGDYPLCHFHDLRVVPVLRRFKERLAKVETDSKGRDQSRPISYPFLFPSNVAQSVHI